MTRGSRRFVGACFTAITAVTTSFILAISPAHAAACTPSSSTDGSATVLQFTSTGSCQWTVPNGVTNADVLIVAGGGGGGGFAFGGGGGAGGILYGAAVAVTAGNSISIAVGEGGAGGANANDSTGQGTSGSNSSFGSATAIGGGAGGGFFTKNGSSGGSGGGSSEGGSATTSTQTAPSGFTAYGNPGGAVSNNQAGSGGGGAGSPGAAVTTMRTGGNGGSGYAFSITGTSTYFGGGGGGGGRPGTISSGGIGGGGAGGVSDTQAAVAGTANTGGGGGGAGFGDNGAGTAGANGGSGIVIVRFTTPYTPTTNAVDQDCDGTYDDAFTLVSAGNIARNPVSKTYSSGPEFGATTYLGDGSLGISSCADIANTGETFVPTAGQTLTYSFAAPREFSSIKTISASRTDQARTSQKFRVEYQHFGSTKWNTLVTVDRSTSKNLLATNVTLDSPVANVYSIRFVFLTVTRSTMYREIEIIGAANALTSALLGLEVDGKTPEPGFGTGFSNTFGFHNVVAGATASAVDLKVTSSAGWSITASNDVDAPITLSSGVASAIPLTDVVTTITIRLSKSGSTSAAYTVTVTKTGDELRIPRNGTYSTWIGSSGAAAVPTSLPSSCKTAASLNTKGLASDGTYLYRRVSVSASNVTIIKQTMPSTGDSGQVVNCFTIDRAGIPDDSTSLAYSNGYLFVMDELSKVYRIDTTSWSSAIVTVTAPTGKGIEQGQGWMSRTLTDTAEGQIGLLTDRDCSSESICIAEVRLYDVSIDGNLEYNTDKSFELSAPHTDELSGWPDDNHGIAMDGKYIYRIFYTAGYQVYNMETKTLVWKDRSTLESALSMGNITWIARNHVTGAYVLGDYNSNKVFAFKAGRPAIPRLTKPVISTYSKPSSTELSLSWAKITNASSYVVIVDGKTSSLTCTLVGSTCSATITVDSNWNEAAIRAQGDGINFLDSENSDAISSSGPTTIALVVVADNKTVTYGSAAPAYTYTLHQDTASGETVTPSPALTTSPTCSSAYSSSTSVAVSPVTISCSGAADDRYTFTYESAAVTINKAQPTISYTGSTFAVQGQSFNFASSISHSCGAVTYTVSPSPLTGSGTRDFSSGTFSTSTWQNGAYSVTASTASNANCDAASDDSGTFVLALPGNAAYGGGFTTYAGYGRSNVAFQVQQQPKTTPTVWKGQIVWNLKNYWRFKGTLSSFGKTTISGVSSGMASGRGDIYWWDPTLNSGFGGWALAAASITVTITFQPTTSTTKSSSPGSFAISFASFAAPAGSTPSALGNLVAGKLTALKSGLVKML